MACSPGCRWTPSPSWILDPGLTRGWRSAAPAGTSAWGDLAWGPAAFLGGSALTQRYAGRKGYFKLSCERALQSPLKDAGGPF